MFGYAVYQDQDGAELIYSYVLSYLVIVQMKHRIEHNTTDQ